MVYSSVEEICKEFGLDSSLDISSLISELTKKQKYLHPDENNDCTEEDARVLSRLNDAKDYLRQKDKHAMIYLSDVVSIITSMNNNELTSLEQKEKIQAGIKSSCEKIVKNIKGYYLPRKLTVAGVLALVSFVWAFPSVITEHPLLQKFYINDSIYLIITMLWLHLLFISITLLVIAHRNETYIKNVLNYLENIDNQYNVLSDFLLELNMDEKTFTSRELEEFILKLLSSTSKFNSPKRIRVPRQLLPHVVEIVPKIADMIIIRALEKGVISKDNKRGWYDKYKVEYIEKNDSFQ